MFLASSISKFWQYLFDKIAKIDIYKSSKYLSSALYCVMASKKLCFEARTQDSALAIKNIGIYRYHHKISQRIKNVVQNTNLPVFYHLLSHRQHR